MPLKGINLKSTEIDKLMVMTKGTLLLKGRSYLHKRCLPALSSLS